MDSWTTRSSWSCITVQANKTVSLGINRCGVNEREGKNYLYNQNLDLFKSQQSRGVKENLIDKIEKKLCFGTPEPQLHAQRRQTGGKAREQKGT
jgi:hypothetical protein